MSLNEMPGFDDAAGRPHEEIGSEQQEQPCQHERRSVNFSTCYLQCQDCGQNLLDLNGFIEPALRVKR
jgi:hypothetical protein